MPLISQQLSTGTSGRVRKLRENWLTQLQLEVEEEDQCNVSVVISTDVVYHPVSLWNRVCLLSEKREVTELLAVLREQLSNLLARIDFYSSW